MPKISGAKQIINPDEKEKICREVLTSLPEWSGKDKSIDVHAAACRMLPLWADIDEGTVRGFIALRETAPTLQRYTLWASRRSISATR